MSPTQPSGRERTLPLIANPRKTRSLCRHEPRFSKLGSPASKPVPSFPCLCAHPQLGSHKVPAGRGLRGCLGTLDTLSRGLSVSEGTSPLSRKLQAEMEAEPHQGELAVSSRSPVWGWGLRGTWPCPQDIQSERGHVPRIVLSQGETRPWPREARVSAQQGSLDRAQCWVPHSEDSGETDINPRSPDRRIGPPQP